MIAIGCNARKGYQTPLWVISGHARCKTALPRKRILIASTGMSALCQQRTLTTCPVLLLLRASAAFH